MKHLRSYVLLALFGLLLCCAHKPAVHSAKRDLAHLLRGLRRDRWLRSHGRRG